MVINISFKVTGSKEFSVAVEPEITVLDLKKKCAEHTEIPVDAQRLIFKGKILKDKENLTFYNVTDGSTMHLVRRTAPATEPSANENVNKPENTNPEATNAATNNFSDMGTSPFLQMIMNSGGVGGMNNFGGNVHGGEGMGLGSLADLMNAEGGGLNRDIYQTVMNSPLTRSLISELSNNPEMLSNVINNNEFLRNALSQNPVMQQVFENPDLLRELFNPEVIQAGLRFENALNMNNNLNATTNTAANVGATSQPGINTPGDAASGQNMLGGGLNLEQLMNTFGNIAALRANNNNNNNNMNTNNNNPSAGTPAATTTTTPTTTASNVDGGNSGAAATVATVPSNNNLGTQPRMPNMMPPFLQSPDLYLALEQMLLTNPNLGNFNMNNLNMGGMNLGMNMNQPVTDTRPLEEIYESQLKSLQEMGFMDIAANIQALQETGGDINSAVTRLLERGYN